MMIGPAEVERSGPYSVFDAENVRNYLSAARAIDSGAYPNDLVLAVAAASYETKFNTIFVLPGEEDIEVFAASGCRNMLSEDLLRADRATGPHDRRRGRAGAARPRPQARPT